MTQQEQDFWTELRFSITKSEVFDAYCDWIEPTSYHVNSSISSIKGKIGFLSPDMETFKFKLNIPFPVLELNETLWIKLTPFKLDPDKLIFIGDTLEINLTKN